MAPTYLLQWYEAGYTSMPQMYRPAETISGPLQVGGSQSQLLVIKVPCLRVHNRVLHANLMLNRVMRSFRARQSFRGELSAS